MGWCLSLGRMLGPKEHFYGRTLEECVVKARAALGENEEEE